METLNGHRIIKKIKAILMFEFLLLFFYIIFIKDLNKTLTAKPCKM